MTDMRVKDLKKILSCISDDAIVVIPVVDENDVNRIYGFRKVRTAGVLHCESEEDSRAFCLNGAADGFDLADQIHKSGRDVDLVKILYGGNKS